MLCLAGAAFISCVGTAPTKEVDLVDSLNQVAYTYRYKNLDSSYHAASKAYQEIGLYSQGHAHALNLKDSGCHVIIGLYEGSKSWKRAEEQGFEVFTAAEAAKRADIIMILINDEKQAKLYKDDIEPNLEPGNMLMFAQGFRLCIPG